MNEVIRHLIEKLPVVTDGAWGTQLLARGLVPGECPDSWNLLYPDRVEAVARSYVEVGSRVILTNTFQANRFALGRHGLSGKTVQLNRAGVEISRKVASTRVRVFGSMGPSGKILMMGEVSQEDLQSAFSEQARALASGGVDGIVIETMSDLCEAKLAVHSVKATGLPVVACMAFDFGANKDRTIMGHTPEQAARELAAAGADVVGANCGSGIEAYVSVCERLHSSTDRPIWIKPNAGMPQVVEGRTVYKTTPQEFARHGPALISAGATFIGGCCGTNAEFIHTLIESLKVHGLP